MIFSNTSNYMLKYQKAKAKLVEYDIPQKDYPKFPLNSNELLLKTTVKMIASINLYQSFLRHFLKGIRARPTIILQN